MGFRPHPRRAGRSLGLVLSLIAIAACSNARADSTSTSTSVGTALPDESAVTTVASMEPSTTVAAALIDTGTPGVATSLIDDCVAFVQYGAFIGNSLLTEMWNAAGQDVATMRTTCEVTGRADITALEGMTAQWAEIQRYTSAATAPATSQLGADPTPIAPDADAAPATPTATDAAVAPPGFECDPNYTGCVPITSDVDCVGDGDGPAFQSEPVGVIVKDIYGLDPDGNRVGCG